MHGTFYDSVCANTIYQLLQPKSLIQFQWDTIFCEPFLLSMLSRISNVVSLSNTFFLTGDRGWCGV